MDWVYLTSLFKQAPVPTFWLTKTFGKRVEFSPLPKVKIRSETSSVSVSSLGKLYDPPKPVRISANVNEVEIAPAQIYEYDTITEELIASQNFNPQVLAVDNVNDVISSKDYLYATKVRLLKERHKRRLEVMFAELISTGKINYNDGKRKFLLDTGVSSSAYSLSSSTKVINDLMDLVDEIKASGFNPEYIIVTKDVAKALWDNTQFKDAVSKNGVNIGALNYRVEEPYVRFVGEINGLPPIYYYANKYSFGGSTYDAISGSKIIVASTEVFTLTYGAIINKHLNAGFRPVQADVAVWESTTEDGSQIVLYMMSRPLPYIGNVNGVKILNVTIS